jgi:hypothetical protein
MRIVVSAPAPSREARHCHQQDCSRGSNTPQHLPCSSLSAAHLCPAPLSGCRPLGLQVHVDEAAGDVLVFLTGQEEIEAAERLLTERAAALAPGAAALQLMVVPIYAAMPPDQQLKVNSPASPCIMHAKHRSSSPWDHANSLRHHKRKGHIDASPAAHCRHCM